MTEIESVYKKCKGLLSVLITDEQSRSFFGPMDAMAGAARQHSDLKYLKRLLKELLLISQTFPQVTSKLLAELGIEIPSVEAEVEKVVKRRKIANAEQFRMVSEYVDGLVQVEPKHPLLPTLNQLLREFEQATS